MLPAELSKLHSAFAGSTSRFRKGLTLTEIERIETKMRPTSLPDDLRILYSWRDGYCNLPIPDYAPFGFDWCSLSRSIDQRDNTELKVIPYFEDFLPVGDFGSAIVLASLSKFHQDRSVLFLFDPSDGQICLFHSNIEAMVGSATEWLSDMTLSPDEIRLRRTPNAWLVDQEGTTGPTGVSNTVDLFNCSESDLKLFVETV